MTSINTSSNLFATIIIAALGVANYGSALANSDPAYKHVFSSNGIACNGMHAKSLHPILADDGYFVCECSTDTDCAINNPHRQEYNLELDPKYAARAPKGTSCNNAILWTEARRNIGRTLVIAGPVANVTMKANSPKSPTWINIGAKFPSTNRLSLVVFESSNIPAKALQPKELEGKHICAIGKISSYLGSPQIILKTANDFLVSK